MTGRGPNGELFKITEIFEKASIGVERPVYNYFIKISLVTDE